MKQLFYSNGIDVFGPVDLQEFSKNRYYKSTLIWYEGLEVWVNINDCDELKHLIGTMATPSIDIAVAHSLPDLTPPLTKQLNTPKNKVKRYAIISSVIVTLIVLLSFYYWNIKPTNAAPVALEEGALPIEPKMIPIDSVELLKKQEAETIRKSAEIKTYRMNWSKFVSATTNEYKSNELGGISDLKILLKNNCPYKIDYVLVQVNYLKQNGSVYLTEMLDFNNIEANTSSELFAPNSDRGVKISCSIKAIRSEGLNLCFDKTAKNFKKLASEDPYQCVGK
ncbi:MAG: hypothetical protein PSX81_08145 [bacterium]|nr:hypothetical protein [bacterium]